MLKLGLGFDSKITEKMCSRSVTAYRTHVHHTIAELDEGSSIEITNKRNRQSICLSESKKRHTPFQWYIKVGDVVQHEVDEGSVFLLSEEADKGL